MSSARRSEAERQSTSLAALALTLALVVIGLYLVERLRSQASEEDCVLSGRSVCGVQPAP